MVAAVGLSIGSLFWIPDGALAWSFDILGRSYALFVLGVMGHEAAHGHLGATRRANLWWGRIALFPTLVPFNKFRVTHQLHHRYTNVPGRDPDYFLHTDRPWQVPFRAMLLSQQWTYWLRKNGRLRGRDIAEIAISYALVMAVYLVVATQVGFVRPLVGVLAALTLQSWVLWYAFGIRTHEGYSTGAPEERSHDYYGRALYWLTFGLSLHRVHHLKPQLSWRALRPYVQPVPGTGWQRLGVRRSIRSRERSGTRPTVDAPARAG